MIVAQDSSLYQIQSEDGDDADQRSKVRLVVPNNCCGAIIGKSGATIKYAFLKYCNY